MTASNQPVSSFGAELQAALREGANRRLRIEFDDPRMAIRFQARLNALRVALRKAAHPDWEQMYRAGISIDKENPRVLVIQPKDAEFRDALRAAKVQAPPDPLTSHVVVETPVPGVSRDGADDFLATLTQATEVPHEVGARPLPKTDDEG